LVFSPPLGPTVNVASVFINFYITLLDGTHIYNTNYSVGNLITNSIGQVDRISFTTTFAIPTTLVNVKDVFFGVGGWFHSFTAATLANSYQVTLEALATQPAAKRPGLGPQCLVAYISGASTSQSVIINATQYGTHIPKPGVITGFAPKRSDYSPVLHESLQVLTKGDKPGRFRSVFRLKDYEQEATTFQLSKEIVAAELLMDDGTYEPDEVLETINYVKKLVEGREDLVPSADLKSFFKKAAKWVEKNVLKPVAQPIGQAVNRSARTFGQIGANAIDAASNAMAATAREDFARADTYSSFSQPGQRGPVNSQNFIRRASTKGLNQVGGLIMKAADTYYKGDQYTDRAMPETALPTTFLRKDQVTLFPVILESEESGPTSVFDFFPGLNGGAIYAVAEVCNVNPKSYEPQTPGNKIFNYDDKEQPHFQPKSDMILMKLISYKNGKVELAQPANFVTGLSFELALWMYEHGFTGISYLYTGCVINNQIQPIPGDTMGVKRAVAKRNSLALVGNSRLADYPVSTIGTLYKELCLTRFSTQFGPRAATESQLEKFFESGDRTGLKLTKWYDIMREVVSSMTSEEREDFDTLELWNKTREEFFPQPRIIIDKRNIVSRVVSTPISFGSSTERTSSGFVTRIYQSILASIDSIPCFVNVYIDDSKDKKMYFSLRDQPGMPEMNILHELKDTKVTIMSPEEYLAIVYSVKPKASSKPMAATISSSDAKLLAEIFTRNGVNVQMKPKKGTQNLYESKNILREGKKQLAKSKLSKKERRTVTSEANKLEGSFFSVRGLQRKIFSISGKENFVFKGIDGNPEAITVLKFLYLTYYQFFYDRDYFINLCLGHQEGMADTINKIKDAYQRGDLLTLRESFKELHLYFDTLAGIPPEESN